MALTTCLVDGQSHVPVIGERQLYSQGHKSGIGLPPLFRVALYASDLPFNIVVRVTTAVRMTGNTSQTSRPMNRLSIFTTVHIQRKQISILKTCLEIRIGMTHQAIGIRS
jgi:hypothetical protein